MVLSHVMTGQVGTTIACCLVSCLHLSVVGQSSYGNLSRQSSQWLKNLKIIVNFNLSENEDVSLFQYREQRNKINA